MPNQMSVVRGGRRRKPTNVSMINAQTPFLYPMAEARETRKYREDTLALEESNMMRADAARKADLEEVKKQNKTANLIALGNLGITTGFGIADIMGRSGGGGGTGVTKAPTKPSWLAKTGKGFKTAGSKGSPWLAGGAGILAGQTIGKGRKPYKKALIGAGAGAAASWLSGGDAYESIISGVVGGLGSLI